MTRPALRCADCSSGMHDDENVAVLHAPCRPRLCSCCSATFRSFGVPAVVPCINFPHRMYPRLTPEESEDLAVPREKWLKTGPFNSVISAHFCHFCSLSSATSLPILHCFGQNRAELSRKSRTGINDGINHFCWVPADLMGFCPPSFLLFSPFSVRFCSNSLLFSPCFLPV